MPRRTLEAHGAPDLNTDSPQVLMTVANPVGSGIVRSLGDTGRAKLTGTWSRMPETETLQTMRDLMPSLRHIGLQFNGDEKNSTVKRDETALAAEQGLTITARESAPEGRPAGGNAARAN